MSNTGQIVTTAVATIIGFVVGGPTGAAYGFQLGLLAGSALFPTQLPAVTGPRIEDLQTTSAQVGVPVVETWGTVAVPGTVMWLGPLVETATTEEVGGKGAPEQDVTTFTYTQSIAVGLCQGEIGGVLRIWENGKLVYDIRPQQEDETDDEYLERSTATYAYQATFTLYLGTDLQNPDPTIEAVEGVGSVPGFRDLAYIVFPNRQLTDEQARRHPQWRFEVFKGLSPRSIIRPTDLPDEHLAVGQPAYVDWTHDRYYAFDFGGSDNGVRVYSLTDDTELQEVQMEDMLAGSGNPNADLGAGSICIGFQGHLYFGFFTTIFNVQLVKINPQTMTIETQRLSGGATEFWRQAIAMHVPGPLGGIDVILSASLLGPFFAMYDGRDLGGSAFWTPAAAYDSGSVVEGRLTPSGRRYGYALAVDGALTGSAGPLLIREVSAFYNPFLALLEFDTTAAELEIEPSTLDPTWTRFSAVRGFWYDQTDDTLIIGAEGGTAAFGDNQTRLFKYDFTTEEIVWSVDTTIPVTDGGHAMSVVQNSRLALLGPGSGDTRYFDTRTGEYETITWTDLGTWTGGETFDAGSNRMVVFEGTPTNGWIVLEFGRPSPQDVSLAEIVSTVTDELGYLPGEIDVTDLETIFVHGYARPRQMPGRSVIEPLRMVGFFDCVESQGALKFPTRGKAIVATLTDDDLGAHDESADAPADPLTRKLTDVELPRSIRVHYVAPSRDYEPGEQISPVRLITDAVNDMDIDLAVALEDNQAAQISEVLWADAWRARWLHTISVDRYWSELEPADAIAVPVDGRLERLRITALDDHDASLLRRFDLVRDDDGAYESTRIADPPAREPSVLRYLAATELMLLDLPPLREEDNDPGVYAAAARTGIGTTWPGAIIQRSLDGFTWGAIGSVASEAITGRVAVALPSGISSTWDDANTLEVILARGALESRTENDLLNGHANAAAIGDHGRWEIVQFLNAVEVSPDRWQLTGLLRGRRGTEHFIGTSQVNDRFVLVSGPGIIRLPLDTSQIGDELHYVAVTAGTSFSSATQQLFTGNGLALETFSPVDITGERDMSDNLTIAWARRDRLFETMQDGVLLPLSEDSEAYEIDIMDGSSVVRTLTSSTPTVAYSAADQTTDFGAPVPAVEVHVYQMSAIVGRGTPGVAII